MPTPYALLCAIAASVCLAQTSAATPSQKGLIEHDRVQVHSALNYFTGSLQGARDDPDPNVYIACGVTASKPNGGTLRLNATCAARDDQGNGNYCTSRDPNFIRAVNSINVNSAFTVDYGETDDIHQCDRISVFTGSIFNQ